LKSLQLLEGFVERALETAFVAGHLAVGIVFKSIVGKDVGEVGLAVQVGIDFFPHFLAALETQGEEAWFHLANAIESPTGDDHVFDQDLLYRTDGLALFFEGEAELLEIDFLFDCGQNDFDGGEAVFEGIVAHSGASLRCNRTVAFSCIATVRVLLSFGDHANPSYPDGTGDIGNCNGLG
jgi:hypothetical protein